MTVLNLSGTIWSRLELFGTVLFRPVFNHYKQLHLKQAKKISFSCVCLTFLDIFAAKRLTNNISVIASVAWRSSLVCSRAAETGWIASSLPLLAMTRISRDRMVRKGNPKIPYRPRLPSGVHHDRNPRDTFCNAACS